MIIQFEFGMHTQNSVYRLFKDIQSKYIVLQLHLQTI